MTTESYPRISAYVTITMNEMMFTLQMTGGATHTMPNFYQILFVSISIQVKNVKQKLYSKWSLLSELLRLKS